MGVRWVQWVQWGVWKKVWKPQKAEPPRGPSEERKKKGFGLHVAKMQDAPFLDRGLANDKRDWCWIFF